MKNIRKCAFCLLFGLLVRLFPYVWDENCLAALRALNEKLMRMKYTH